ncbi:MAG: flagellar hook assembly protein FlgD [Burkholderiales bacterium]|nr:flagellar hook assembly protein FlgD [Burkholderiales bacterium]
MTAIAPVAPAAASATPAAQPSQQSATQDRFLTLRGAQLKNQDPLNPMDNAQVTTQMAQISTVSGIDRLNSTLQSLAGDLSATQPLQAAGLVGRQVLVPGATIALAGGGAAAGFSLPQAVDNLTITITDASGIAVNTVRLGAQSAGLHTFTWDGLSDAGLKAAEGGYGFSVAATAAGRAVAARSLSLARVDAIRPDAQGFTLELAGRGSARLADVQQIF